MLKGDDGKFLRQLTDLIFGQNLTNALSFFEMNQKNRAISESDSSITQFSF